MNKKITFVKNLKYALITLCFVLVSLFNNLGVFAKAEEAAKDYKTVSIVFIIVDIVLFFVMYFMIKKYSALRKKIDIEKQLNVYTLGVLLAFTKSLFVILLVVGIVLFLAICEFAYLINQSKKELSELRRIAQEKSDAVNERLAKGNISYVMTSDGWYDICIEECEHIKAKGENPILYLKEELVKEEKASVRDDARIEGLQRALKEVEQTYVE